MQHQTTRYQTTEHLNKHPVNQLAMEILTQMQTTERFVRQEMNLAIIDLLRWAEKLHPDRLGSRGIQTLERVQEENPQEAMNLILGRIPPSQVNREEIEITLENLDPRMQAKELRWELVGSSNVDGLIGMLELEKHPEWSQTVVG